jgi:hypothetical protein
MKRVHDGTDVSRASDNQLPCEAAVITQTLQRRQRLALGTGRSVVYCRRSGCIAAAVAHSSCDTPVYHICALPGPHAMETAL